MIIEPASTSQSIDVFVCDDAGLAVTGLVAATFPPVSWSLAGSTAAVPITLSDLALITTAWTSGGLKERSGGFYRLDLPDAALTTAGTVTLIGDASGKHLLAEPIVIATATTLASLGPVVAGAYFDSNDLDDFYGARNIDIYSDLSNAGVRDTARISKWITITVDWINLAWTRAGRTTPIPDTEPDFTALKRIGAEWCGAYLAKGRGDLPQGVSNADAFDSLMDGHIERAEKALADLVSAWEAEDEGAATQMVVPAIESAGPSVDARGCNLPTKRCCGTWGWPW